MPRGAAVAVLVVEDGAIARAATQGCCGLHLDALNSESVERDEGEAGEEAWRRRDGGLKVVVSVVLGVVGGPGAGSVVG